MRPEIEEVLSGAARWAVVEGEALATLQAMPDASVDAVVTDPPYPEINRDYGRMTEAEWMAIMQPLVREMRRVLKPRGSAVLILQPNSERVGRMRGWLWRFLAWCVDEWNVVQDAYWWNTCALPLSGAAGGGGSGAAAEGKRGLLRASIKMCVWLGSEDCHRNQGAVLMALRDAMTVKDIERRAKSRIAVAERRGHRVGSTGRVYQPSGIDIPASFEAKSIARGGTIPFNCLPFGNAHGGTCGGAKGHGAATPLALASWWTRYICPPGGVVLDPFGGSGTMGEAALSLGRRAILVERHAPYVPICRATCEQAARQGVLDLAAGHAPKPQPVRQLRLGGVEP